MTEKALTLLGEKKFSQLKQLLSEMNPVDIAGILEEMPQESLPLVYRLLPKELAAEAFAEMDKDLQEILIQAFSDKELQEVLDELYLDDAVDIIEEMPANVVKRILRQTKPEVRKKINEILHYPCLLYTSAFSSCAGTGNRLSGRRKSNSRNSHAHSAKRE